MSIIDWLFVAIAIVGALSLLGLSVVVGIARAWLRSRNRPDDRPRVRTKIIRPNPEHAMARAAAEAGYITNADYLDVVNRINAEMEKDIDEQGNALVDDLGNFVRKEFPRRCLAVAASERPAPASSPVSPAGAGQPFGDGVAS